MWYFIVSSGIIIGKVTYPGEGYLDASIYQESKVGSAPVWPRLYRNSLLAASDWTQLADTALTSTQVAEARSYREQLRNLPTRVPDPAAAAWPTCPSFINAAG